MGIEAHSILLSKVKQKLQMPSSAFTALLRAPCSLLLSFLIAFTSLVIVISADPVIQHPKGALKPEDWRRYCASMADNFDVLRRIPPMKNEISSKNPQLAQVLVLTRHGARTPAGYFEGCWEGYAEQKWNCESQEASVSINRGAVAASGGEAQSDSQLRISDSLEFVKRYHDPIAQNALHGTCQKGQLITEGTIQHQTIGRLLAEAYFPAGDKAPVWPHPLVTSEEWASAAGPDSFMHFRSTDMQRTRLSGANLITSLINNAFGGSLPSEVKLRAPTLHTVDHEAEYMYFNEESAKHANASKEFEQLRRLHEPLIERLHRDLKTGQGLKNPWPEDLHDCMMTTACDASHADQLPKALVDHPDLLQEAFNASVSEIIFPFLWSDRTLSRQNSKQLVDEMRNNIVKNLCTGCETLSDFEALDKRLRAANSVSNVFPHVHETIFRMNPKRFMLWSAHDKTIIAFLASLGPNVFDGLWPPYASVVAIEVYKASDAGTAFRLIYNAEDITHRIVGCEKMHICSISKLLGATDWVDDTQNKIAADSVVSLENVDLGEHGKQDSFYPFRLAFFALFCVFLGFLGANFYAQKGQKRSYMPLHHTGPTPWRLSPIQLPMWSKGSHGEQLTSGTQLGTFKAPKTKV